MSVNNPRYLSEEKILQRLCAVENFERALVCAARDGEALSFGGQGKPYHIPQDPKQLLNKNI